MGVGLYVALESEIGGLNPVTEVDGKVLSRRLDDLDKLALASGVKKPSEFISFNVEEVSAFLEGEGIDDVEVPPEKWFDPEDGIPSIQALISNLHSLSLPEKEMTAVQQDLTAIARILSVAKESNVRFHLAMDTP